MDLTFYRVQEKLQLQICIRGRVGISHHRCRRLLLGYKSSNKNREDDWNDPSTNQSFRGHCWFMVRSEDRSVARGC